MTHWAPRPRSPARGWVFAKWAVLTAFGAFVVALLAAPEPTARLFWYGFVPLLPALFLVNVELWRNVCPFATLNTLLHPPGDPRPLSRRAGRIAGVVGVLMLLVGILVRRTMLDGNGVATAAVLATFGVMALFSGLAYRRKAGFCNSICPVLPVERLYGSRPLRVVQNARCTPCRACTHGGCIDLGPERAALVSLGPTHGGAGWIRTPFGAFALAFPGIVAGFFLGGPAVVEGGGAIVLGAAVSWTILGAMFTTVRTSPADALGWSAATAAALFYWFGAASSVEAFALPPALTPALRVAALVLVALWVWSGLLRKRGTA